jgi:hypothetical protein
MIIRMDVLAVKDCLKIYLYLRVNLFVFLLKAIECPDIRPWNSSYFFPLRKQRPVFGPIQLTIYGYVGLFSK